MMVKRMALIVCIVFTLVSTTSCWNNKDLTEMSISAAIGIDKMDDGRIMVSVQIVKPSAIKAGGKESGGGGGQKAFVVVNETADTVFGALRAMLGRLNRKIFYSSAQVIVLGESATKSGITDFIDFFKRDHESQYKADVVVSKGVSAKEILEQGYDLANVPGVYIADTLKNSNFRAMVKRTMLIEMFKQMGSKETQLSIGTISKKGISTSTEGTAVFFKDKEVGWLDKFETRGYLFAANKVTSTILEVPNIGNPGKLAAIELMRSKTKLGIEWDNERPVFTVDVKPEGNIGEQQDGSGLKEDVILKKLITACNEKIKGEILSAITKCQKEYKSDIFGFGEALHKSYPDYWRSVENKWNETEFPQIAIKVNVKTELFRTGLVKEPLPAE